MNKFRIAKAGISVNEGIERLGGDVDEYENLLIGFLDDPYYKKLLNAIEQGDDKGAFEASHALKGCSGSLSMTAVFNAVQPIVEMVRENGAGGNADPNAAPKTKSQEMADLLPPLEEAYNKVINAITDMKNSKK